MLLKVNIVQKFTDSEGVKYFYDANKTLYFKRPQDKKVTPFHDRFERIRNIFSHYNTCYILDDSNRICVCDLTNLCCTYNEISHIEHVDKLFKYNGEGIIIIVADHNILFYSLAIEPTAIKEIAYNKNNIYGLVSDAKPSVRSENKLVHNAKTFGEYIFYKTKNFIVCLKYDEGIKVICVQPCSYDDKSTFGDIIDYNPENKSFVLVDGTSYPNTNSELIDNRYCMGKGVHMYIRDRILNCVIAKDTYDKTISDIITKLGGTLLKVNCFSDKYFLAQVIIDNIERCKILYFENYQTLTRYDQNKAYILSNVGITEMPTFLNVQFIHNEQQRFYMTGATITLSITESIIVQVCKFLSVANYKNKGVAFYFNSNNNTSSGEGVRRQVTNRFCTELSHACKDGFASFDPQTCYDIGQIMHFFVERYGEKVSNIHPYFFHSLSILQGNCTEESLSILCKFRKNDYVEYFQKYYEYKSCPALLSELDMDLKSCDDFLEFILGCGLDNNAIIKYHNFAKGYFDYCPHVYTNIKLAKYYHMKRIIPKKVIKANFTFGFGGMGALGADAQANVHKICANVQTIFCEIFDSFSTKGKKNIIANITGTSSWVGFVKVNFRFDTQTDFDSTFDPDLNQNNDNWKRVAYRIATCSSKIYVMVKPTSSNIKTLLEILSTADYGSRG